MFHLNNFKLIHLNTFLLFLIPTALISGPFIPDLIASISSLIFLIIIIKEKNLKYLKNIFSYFFLLFYLYILLSSVLSSNVLLSFESTLFYFRFYLFSLSIWMILDQNEKNIKLFFYSFIIPFYILFLDALLQYTFHYNILGIKLAANYRVSSFFGTELIMGSYASKFFPLIIGLFVFSFPEKNSKKLILAFIILTFYLLVFLSQERASFFIISTAIIYFIIYFSEYRKFLLFTFSFSIFIFFLFLQFNHYIFDRMIVRTLKQSNIVNILQSEEKLYFFSFHHEGIYKNSLELFKENIFFGIGPKIFREKCPQIVNTIIDGCSTHPHNYYLQFLSETGIFGFVFFIIFFLYLLKEFIFNLHRKNYSKFIKLKITLIFSIILIIFIPVPSGNFFNNWLSLMNYIPIGFYLYANSKVLNESE